MDASLDLLFVSSFPASPPTFGAQRRLDGLMRALAKRHRISFVGLMPPEFDGPVAAKAMREYCREVELVPWRLASGSSKRIAQLRSLVSLRSHERRTMNTRELQAALDRVLCSRRFDAVSIEVPSFVFSDVRKAPGGARPPKVVLDAHNVEFDLARQYGVHSSGVLRRLHHGLNWRKMRAEEIHAWGAVDGVAFTSPDDQARARSLFPTIRSAVVPNGVDTERFRPRPDLAAMKGRTVVFFGTMNYFPNLDAVRWLLRDIWPGIASRDPDVRLQIIGSHPPPDVLAHRGPRVEITGLVDDLPAYLARAAAILVPLRMGGGTRLKILESMSMGKAIVSTTLGAEGIGAKQGQEILLADESRSLVDATCSLLADPLLAERMGEAGRALAERAYSWDASARIMDRFLVSVAADSAQAPLEAEVGFA